MALTPEDVVNKRFDATKFRDGYDQDQVDDFLDEVVVEFRRLVEENEALKKRVAELESGEVGSNIPAPPMPVATPEPTPASRSVVSGSGNASVDEAQSASDLLQLARRLHEEHVREGMEKRDALIAEAQAAAARMVSDAESKQRSELSSLERERTAIQHRIDELTVFERNYRAKLKSYIESQLSELDSFGTGTQPPSPASSAPASGSDFSFGA